MGTGPCSGASLVPACHSPAPLGSGPLSPWTPPFLEEQRHVRPESRGRACAQRQPRVPGACGAVGAGQSLHSPSPRKRMRFLAAVWRGCSFLAVSRAWAARRFQKAGSSSSAGQREREAGQTRGVPCAPVRPGECAGQQQGGASLPGMMPGHSRSCRPSSSSCSSWAPRMPVGWREGGRSGMQKLVWLEPGIG